MKKSLLYSESDLPENKGGKVKLAGVYETYMGRRFGLSVWVVNWHVVTSQLFSEFLMGGNEQRYRFNPKGEAWIDSTMGIEEYEYTLRHEVLEMELMREFRWTYDRAHDFASDTLDVTLRQQNAQRVSRKLKTLSKQEKFVPLLDKLAVIYRAYLGRKNGNQVWIVDGCRVREWLYKDFGFPGCYDLQCSGFIPAGEIWLDSATSCGTLQYALVQILNERKYLSEGASESDAFIQGELARERERKRQALICRKHEALLPPMPVGARDRGVRGL
jgi:hypothetical protein